MMTARLRAAALTLAFLGLTAALLPSRAWSQAGIPVSYSKIDNATMAALGVPLDNGDEFGDAVVNLGDLDGAGPSATALAVGAISDDDGGDHRGAVYILFLDPAGSPLSYQKISSTQGNFTGSIFYADEFGGAIANLGDLDGAGPSVRAIAVGASNDDDGGIDRGAVYVLFLNANGTCRSSQKISNLQGNFTALLEDNDEFGGSVAGLGDLDGAGGSAGALAVGAVYDNDGGLERGAVYVLFLNPTGTVRSFSKISSTVGGLIGALGDGDNFGEDIANLGDLDGAGPSLRTIAVGAVGDGDGGSHRGAVYILFLSSVGTVLTRRKISDTQGNFAPPLENDDNFGTAVASLGDLDGAGGSAIGLAVGAGSDNGAGLDRGASYILLLSSAGDVLSTQEISSSTSIFASALADSDEFGSALTAVGDLDGGGLGVMTLAAGSSFDDTGGHSRGAVYLINLSGPVVVGVGDAPVAPGARLGAPRPSVFDRQTTVPYHLSGAGRVRLDVWDAGGRLVRRLIDQSEASGDHVAVWDGADEAGRAARPGAYFLRMSVDDRVLPGAAKALIVR